MLFRSALAYAVLAYVFPDVREVVPASLPVGVGVALVYAALMGREPATA